MRTAVRLLALAWTLLLAACASAPPPAAAGRPVTILVSIDGLHPDDLRRGVTPTLSALAAQGAYGQMRPAFPSKTFPNHYTLVTGLRPDRHGVVDNTMEDPQISGVTFRMSNRQAVGDRRWWDDGEPLWVTAERAGLKTATMFWPGSEAAVRGVRPSLWLPFDQAMSSQARVDQALAWLSAAEPPRFLTLYFDEVDTAGHRYGPGAAETDQALARVDAAVGRLRAGLAAQGLRANLVVVSDHGMAAVSPERRIFLDDLMPLDAGRTLTLGAFMTLYPAPGREAEVERALIRPHPHLSCWRKGEIPARHRFGSHRRVPPIFCLPETGWTITTRAWAARAAPERGNHGYDPFSPEMAAVFIGHGPAFRRGVRVPTFDNVDVYPLLARLAGVAPADHDGDLDEVGAALRR